MGSGLGRARRHGNVGRGRRRVSPWSPRQAHSASPPTIGSLPRTVVYNTQESTAERPRLQRNQRLFQALPHRVRVLLVECKAGKATKVVFIDCNGRGREVVHTCGSQDQYDKLLLFLPKSQCGMWVGFKLIPNTDSRPYRTVFWRSSACSVHTVR